MVTITKPLPLPVEEGRNASKERQAFTMTWIYFHRYGTEEQRQRTIERGAEDLIQFCREEMLQDPVLQERIRQELLARPSWQMKGSWLKRMDDLIDACGGDVMAAADILEARRVKRHRAGIKSSDCQL